MWILFDIVNKSIFLVSLAEQFRRIKKKGEKKINKNSIKIDINIRHLERLLGEGRERELIVLILMGAVKNDHQQINDESNFRDLCPRILGD